MKTSSRNLATLLMLFTLVVTAQGNSLMPAVTTIKQQSSIVLATQGKFQFISTPVPGTRLPLSTHRLPSGFANPQTRQPAYPRMPSVVGVELNRARSVITQTQSRVRISVVEGRYTNNYQPGVVIQQTPESGAYLKPESEVILYYNPQPSFPRMPNLIGQDVATAESRLIRLAPNSRPQRIISREHNPSYAEGVVINQFPQPRTELRPEVRVVLYINPAQRFPKMPGLIGLDIKTAETRLYRVAPNIQPQKLRARRHNPAYAENVVVSQSPDAEADLTPGIGVVLYLNPPPPVAKMPNLIGMDATAAGNRLRQIAPNVQWRTARADAHNPNYPVGVIVGQTPDAGTELRQEINVGLYLNPQPPPPIPKMPNLLGMDVPSATNKLRQDAPNVPWQQQQASAHNRNYPVGAVVSQSPDAGTELRRGSRIMLSLNPRPTPTPQPTPVTVPDVRGLSYGEANSVLTKEQLRITATSNPSGNISDFRVTGQRPLPGGLLPIGETVFVTIEPPPSPATPTPTPGPTSTPSPTLTPSPSPAPVLVLDVRKKTLTEAIGLLRGAQLEVGEVSEKDPKETASVVLEQQPLPGQRVAIGTRVNLVIGKQADSGGFLKEIPKVLGVMGLGFLAFLLSRVWKYFRRTGGQSSTGGPSISPPPDPEPPPTTPAISFRTTMNAGSPEFAASTELHTSFALQFQPKADWGQQTISLTSGLVAAESEEL